MKYSPKEMQNNMKKNEFVLKKKFGQNFIVDENIIDSIVNKSEIDKETMVVEIGPGAGSLTYKLGLKAKNVLCYEVDTSVEGLLKNNIKNLDNVEIIFEDFLKVNLNKDLEKYEYEKLYVVANLPYYITTPIIVKLIEESFVDKIVVMVQKEVGDRFKAKPGSKDYGSLSIYLNLYYDVKKLLDVSKHIFIPKPRVDSIVVAFERKTENYDLKNKDIFFKLVRDSFKQKRKTIKNNLKEYNLEIIETVLIKYGYNLSVRAEQLPIEIFVDIANNLK